MVDFSLSDEQREYQKLAHDFAQRELLPRAHQFDMSGAYPEELLNKAWQTGLVNPQLPEDCGGLALKLWDTCIILEELARGCSGISAAIEASALAMLPLILKGSNEQKQRLLAPMADNFQLAGIEQSSLFNKSTLRAAKAANGYKLSGRADNVLNGSVAQFIIVAASTDGAQQNGKKEHKFSLFAVAPKSALKISEKQPTLGRKAADYRTIEFDDLFVESSDLIGEEGCGQDVIDLVRPHALSILASSCVGVAQCGLEHAIRYSKERHTFRVPIAQHQAVAFMIADMAKDITAGRLLVSQAATLIDGGSPDWQLAAQAKAFAQDAAMKVATDAVQVFGGYGYSKEYPVEKLMRDAKTYQLFDGIGHQLKSEMGRRLLASV